MISTLLLALALISAHNPPSDTQVAEAPPMLQVSGPTFFADGQIRGGTTGRPDLKLNQPIELYQVSGKTLCESSSATAGKPNDAGSGWRLVIVPLKLGRELVLGVSWQRLWERGETLTNGPKGSAVVTLKPGDHLMLDYITAGDLIGGTGDPNRPVVRFSPACGAIGMGLQIGLTPAESEIVIESNLWLVRTLANGSERSVQHAVRSRLGNVSEFFLDDEKVVFTAPKDGRSVAPPTEQTVRTSGRLKPLDIVNGRVRMEVIISQDLTDSAGSSVPRSGGSATFEFTAGPDEVVAFRVPRATDAAGRLGERMSLRIQMKVLNR